MRAFGSGGGAFGSSNSLASRISGVRGNSNNGNNQVGVNIRNWEGGGKDDLVGFISRKCKINLQNVSINGPILQATVKSNEAGPLVKWSGVRFAGRALSIALADDGLGNNSGTKSAVEMLRGFLESRYNPSASILDLQNLKGDQYLISNNLFSSASTSSKMFPALMKVAGENIKQVDTVNLADNALSDVVPITTLAQTFPDLKNLSLANNNINNTRVFENWRQKFRSLRELVLSNNPLTYQPNYKDEIMKLFPRLIMLDGQIIRDESQIENPRLPLPIKTIFFEDGSVEQMATGFVTNYFDLFDNNRQQLLQLYDMSSQFSLSLNSIAPRAPGTSGPSNWSSYIPISRNLMKVTAASARHSRLNVGQNSIQAVFQKIPQTRHNLVPERFSLEAWRTVGVKEENDTGIVITIHGEFNETRSNIARSFDRTFIVVQGANGSMIVASDMMTVRGYAGFDAWKETQAQQPPQNSAVPPVAVGAGVTPPSMPVGGAPAPNIPPELVGLNNDQLMVIEKLMQQTRLNAQYARMCAEQAGFDLNQAFALFQQSQGTLPPNAYMA